MGFSIATGSSSLLMPDGEMLPFNQNNIGFSHRANTATPSSVQYAHGSYYHGFLGSWYTATSIRYGNPNQLTTEHALFLKWIRYIGAPKGT